MRPITTIGLIPIDLLACRAHVMVAGTLSTFKSVSMDGTPFRNRILHARTS